jgi:hypothetical protein
MRIIGQSGLIDIPYDKKCIGVTEDGYVVAINNVCERQDVLSHSIIAEYSTKEKALKAIREMRRHYRGRQEYYQFPKEEEI